MLYQLVELDIQATDNIACPHCHQDIINWQEEQYVQPCEHTLFIAMDIGFEYITDEFEQTMRKQSMNCMPMMTSSTCSKKSPQVLIRII